MKKVILMAVIAVFAGTTLAFAGGCGSCGAGEAKAAGEGASHDAEHIAEAKAEKGHMHKAGEDGVAMEKSNISTKAKAKEASSY